MRAVRPGSDFVSSPLLSTSLIYGSRFFVFGFATFTASFFPDALADYLLAGVLPFFFVALLFDAEATDAGLEFFLFDTVSALETFLAAAFVSGAFDFPVACLDGSLPAEAALVLFFGGMTEVFFGFNCAAAFPAEGVAAAFDALTALDFLS